MKVHHSTAKSWARAFYAGASVADIINGLSDKFLLGPNIRDFVEQAIRDYPPKYWTFGEHSRGITGWKPSC